MHYAMGDIQGCAGAFERLLQAIDFSPSRDHLYVLGDLVNRGPQSLQTLRLLSKMGDSATCLLGNHDLHLLAVSAGVRPLHRSDTVQDILDAPDRAHWIDWLRHQRLAVQAQGWLMVHAGVPPQWDATQTLACAAEVERKLRSKDLHAFLPQMYGNQPACWDDTLLGADRLRFTINALTRMRFVAADGTLDFKIKGSVSAAPDGFYPWFEAPGRRTEGTPVAFGHWSTLGHIRRPDLLAMDTGCVWGGSLTATQLNAGLASVQVSCPQTQAPG